MTSPLEDCTLEEQRSVIRCLVAKGVKPSEIFSRMLIQYGKSCMNRANFYKWVDRFKSGRTSLGGEPRCGRPVEVSDPSLESRIDGLIRDNRRITVEMIAEEVPVSVGTVHNVIQNNLKYRKTCAKWVSRQLTDAHKESRLSISQDLKQQSLIEGDAFFERIVTSDEVWIHHYDPETKRQSMEWKHTSSPVRKKFKVQPSAGKVMLTIFWDLQGPVHCDFLENQRTINSQYYSEMLEHKVRPAIRSKRRGLLSKGVILQHDNARPHTAQLTRDKLQELGWEVLPHPAYSPDLAPSDFYLFGPLQDALRGKRFANNEEVKEVVQKWLRGKSKEFFAKGIRKLQERWDKCITVGGDYVEK
ncbi:Histone-lysine N-methyltransferase SETMAR [Anthophora plagiata]